MADRFNRIDNTAPITDVAEGIDPEVKYSNFDLSRKIIGQALPYALIPIDVIETVPNTKVNLNYDVQITFRNPAVRKMLNGFRVYLHSYYNRKSDLWEGWNNFVTRGRNGNMDLTIPHIATRLTEEGTGYRWSPFTPMSLYNYLGIPSEYIGKKLVNNEYVKDLTKTCGIHCARLTGAQGQQGEIGTETGLGHYANIKISALDAMMYQRLYRDKYAPQNLLINNKNVFPDNEDHFILSYSAGECSVIDYEHENRNITAPNQKYWNTLTQIPESDSYPKFRLDLLRFRQFQGDRFTTASPFQDMLRGTAPTLDIGIDTSDLKAVIPDGSQIVDYTEVYYENLGHTPQKAKIMGYGLNPNGEIVIGTTIAENDQHYDNSWAKGFTDHERKLEVTGDTIVSAIKLSDLRSLEVFTIFAERMARCSGSYNSMIKQQFGHNPKSENREAIYIGGSYQDILLNSIYSTSETNKQALGTQVAQGQSASYNKIGEFTADDYGLVMTIMSIVPETIYTTGISKLKTALTMEEQYFPIMNNLSAEPILNQELYVSGTKETDETPYGYAERFSEYKSRRNRACGLSELSNDDDEYDSALVMARRFNTTQNLNADFVTGHPDNVSLDSFTSNDEAPFDFAIRQDINVVYPMPYVTIPQGLGTRA